MACSKCKKKEERERMEKEIIKNEKLAIETLRSVLRSIEITDEEFEEAEEDAD